MKYILLIHQWYLHHFHRLYHCHWIALDHRMKCFVAFELTFELLMILHPLLNIMKMHAPIHRMVHVCHYLLMCHSMQFSFHFHFERNQQALRKNNILHCLILINKLKPFIEVWKQMPFQIVFRQRSSFT